MMDSMYLWILSVGFWSFLQSHPFMVISCQHKEQHTLDLLIEPQGPDQELLSHAKKGHTINPIIMFNDPHGPVLPGTTSTRVS